MEDQKKLLGLTDEYIADYKDYKYGSVMGTGIGQMIDGLIDYSSLDVNAMAKTNQADQIEINAEERANILLDQFNKGVGNLSYSAARRGIKTTSGSVTANIESSAENLGENIKSMKRNAKTKASAIRTEARIAKKAGKYNALTSLVSSAGGMYAGHKMYGG